MSDNANVASASIFLVILVFVAASGATWVAGVELSKSTMNLIDAWDSVTQSRMVMLAIAGSLPELAITISAAESGHLGLAAGNLIGGIATATMVSSCVISLHRDLSHSRRFLVPVLEGLLVVLTVSVVLMVRCCQSRSHSGAHESGVLGCRGHLDRRHLVLNRTRSHPKWEI